MPLETEVGIIFGRDAIYLDDINFDYSNHQVTFLGELSGGLCSKIPEDKWVKYSLTFYGILAFRMIELDFGDFRGKSSFDLVENSEWIEVMRKYDSAKKIKSEHKHYLLQTYDDIFEIVGQRFELRLLSNRRR